MADTRLFSRLKRLFSTDVIIRNEGGNQLKVMDINKIQQSGEYENNSLVDRFNRIYTNNITQQEIFNAVNVLKEFHNGNYDGFLGFVKNFGFQAREDGGYTCYTELVSVGEVIDSLRIPNISITDPVLNLKGGTETTNGQKANIVVKSDTKVYDANQERYITVTRELDTADFNEALAAGIFPRYNGLLGLIKSIYNYCSFK